jgi:nitronate monooxygenase
VLTDVFDVAIGMPWPEGVSGRVVRNPFVDRWHGRDDELRAWAAEHRDEYLALAADAVDERAVWGGEAASLVGGLEPAGDVVRRLVADATAVLRSRPGDVLRAD